MEKPTVEGVLCELCKKRCGTEVTAEENLLENGKLESFQLLEVICDIEESFGIVLEPEDIRGLSDLSSVNEMARFLKTQYSIPATADSACGGTRKEENKGKENDFSKRHPGI